MPFSGQGGAGGVIAWCAATIAFCWAISLLIVGMWIGFADTATDPTMDAARASVAVAPSKRP